MGRHAAADGAGTDPIVAAALASRPDGTPADRHAPGTAPASAQGTEGDLGWPGDTTTGGGLGWPDATDQDGVQRGAVAQDAVIRGAGVDEVDATARMAAVPAVPGADPDGESEPGPRGWRRLFGGHAA
ncbi:hypothetical protein [Geodermatophilus amargosae]|uniref:hypothetical protein n=1 Tax=Geodermatophilus amargosae TaxID=1296565 RepID=UPI0034DE6263